MPGFVAWEEAFLGRGDVDWIRFTTSAPDPREAHRLKSIWDDLPSVTQRVAGYVALLGGTTGEVVLSRVARLNFPQLAEALLPATGVGLVKVQEGKVTIPHAAWTPLTIDLLPETQRKEMHLEIANALSALSPEPNLARRIDVARHYLSWYPGPMALRHLLEAAELALEFSSFDTAEELLNDALGCLGSLPPAERDPLEPELRLLRAEALFAAGRVAEAEVEFREGVEGALRGKVSPGALAEWVEPLIISMRVVGPRPSLSTMLMELAERCHDAEMVELEVLFEAIIAEFHYERNLPDKARAESHRAARLARQLPDGHLQAVALLAVGLSRIEGSPEEQELAGKFLRAARTLLGRAQSLGARLPRGGPRGALARTTGGGRPGERVAGTEPARSSTGQDPRDRALPSSRDRRDPAQPRHDEGGRPSAHASSKHRRDPTSDSSLSGTASPLDARRSSIGPERFPRRSARPLGGDCRGPELLVDPPTPCGGGRATRPARLHRAVGATTPPNFFGN